MDLKVLDFLLIPSPAFEMIVGGEILLVDCEAVDVARRFPR